MTALDRERELWMGRDWSLDLQLGEQQHARFVESSLLGLTNLGVKSEHPNLLLCALPKSASLYAAQFLSHCFGLANHQIGFDRAGGTIYYPRLLAAKFKGMGTLSHCHAAPNTTTLRLIEVLDLQPLVLTRDLRDALVSRRDMLTRDRRAGNLISPRAMERYLKADEDEQLHTVISLFAPEYLNFLAGWKELAAKGTVRPVFFTYEEITQDDVRTVQRIGDELGLESEEARIVEVRDRLRELGGINLAHGFSGRGHAAFTPRHEERLRDLAHRIGAEQLIEPLAPA